MKINDGFKMRKLGKEFVVVPESSSLINFNKIISFNDTTAYLWESLVGKEFTVGDIVQLLLDRYEVDADTAAADAARLANSWIETGLVSD